MNAISSNTDWQRDETDTKRATYHKARYAQRAGYVAQYEGSDSYNWQDIRYGHRLSGIVNGAAAAMAACDASMRSSTPESPPTSSPNSSASKKNSSCCSRPRRC